ncbi:hypothetical protein ACFQUU_23320 [Herbaspirillum sp. GCM10030257]|uniref:hypothetical protein n=1 Tax=Herbaspirillum sp. GCM10030257 TaxID=3273393 RepID=UPI00361EDDA7
MLNSFVCHSNKPVTKQAFIPASLISLSGSSFKDMATPQNNWCARTTSVSHYSALPVQLDQSLYFDMVRPALSATLTFAQTATPLYLKFAPHMTVTCADSVTTPCP